MGIPTVRRQLVGSQYLLETVQGFASLHEHPQVDFLVRVFDFGVNERNGGEAGASTITHKVRSKIETLRQGDSERLKIIETEHIHNDSHLDSWEPVPGIWRQLKMHERRHNEDILFMMRSLLSDECPDSTFKREARCVDTRWIMLTEDDFVPCPTRFPREMPELLVSDCVHRRDVMALRVSSGGSGYLIPCGNLGRVVDAFERMIDRGPVDSLLSFILAYQPEFKHPPGDDSGMELHHQRQPYLVYKHSLLQHVGRKRTKGGHYFNDPKKWWSYVPDCNSTSLDSAGVLGAEYFQRECLDNRSLVSPCGLRTHKRSGPHSQFNKANWHPWMQTIPK